MSHTLRVSLNVMLALCLLCANASAFMIESWENAGLDGFHNEQGPWSRHASTSPNIVIAFSDQHATQGTYSLAVTTPGGWNTVLIDEVNFTLELGDKELRAALGERLTIAMDVYSDKSIEWGIICVEMQGNGMQWTQLTSDPLRPGYRMTVRFLISPEMNAAFKLPNQWFQFMIAINTTGAGTLYFDNLRAE